MMNAFVGNLPVVAREPSAAERRKNALVCCAEDKNGGWKKIGMAIAAGFAFLGPPNAAQAVRGSGSMFRISEKASEFVLPSEKEAQMKDQRKGETQEKLKNAAGTVLKVAPYVVATGAVVGGGYFALQRFQQNQVKRFQNDLKGVSTTFSDSDFTSPLPKKKQTVDTAAMAKTILEKRKYKFRERKPARDRSAQADVDLFNDRTEATKPKADVGDIFADPADPADSADPTEPTTATSEDGELEFAVKKYLSGGRGISAVVAATAAMSAIQAAVAVQTIGLAVLEGLVVDVVAKIKLMMTGAVAIPPVEAVAKIAATAVAVRALVREAFSKEITVRYEGDAITEELAEEIYRIFSVSVLSQGTAQDMAQVKELEDLQTFLGIPADRARSIYEEVVKEMMKEAMNQANLDPQARKMMEDLRSSFGQEAGRAPGDADQDVMKMMYALQQLLTEQGINEEDAREMREMMKSMGLDAKDLVQNVEMLVNVLGPDAKPLIEQLKKLLVENEPSTSTTDVAAQEVQDAASSAVKQLESIEEAVTEPVETDVEVIKDLSPEEDSGATDAAAPKSWADVIKDFKPTDVKDAVEEVEAAAEQVAAAVEEAAGEQVTAAMDEAKAAGLEFTVTDVVSDEEVAAVQAEFQEVFQAAQQMTAEEEAAEMEAKAASAVEAEASTVVEASVEVAAEQPAVVETSAPVAAEEPAEPLVPPYESPVEAYEWTSVSVDKTEALDNIANNLFTSLNEEAKKSPKKDDSKGSESDKTEAQ